MRVMFPRLVTLILAISFICLCKTDSDYDEDSMIKNLLNKEKRKVLVNIMDREVIMIVVIFLLAIISIFILIYVYLRYRNRYKESIMYSHDQLDDICEDRESIIYPKITKLKVPAVRYAALKI